MIVNCSLDALRSASASDVVVVGGGLVGLILASHLVEMGKTVAVLESGLDCHDAAKENLNNVDVVGHPYSGGRQGRSRRLGGTSNIWGGALIPFPQSDLEAHPHGWHRGLRVDSSDLEAVLSSVEQIFGVDPGPYRTYPEGGEPLQSFVQYSPKWPAFRRRSTASILRSRLKASKQALVVLNATVCAVQPFSPGPLRLELFDADGSPQSLTAKKVILAAGAIETTRILLYSRAIGARFGGSTEQDRLGQCFSDHISAPIASISTDNLGRVAEEFGFRFTVGGMRSVRFQLSDEHRQRLPSAGAFVHIGFSRSEGSAFDALRRILQSLQAREIPRIVDGGHVLLDLPWFVRAAYWRLLKQRALPAKEAIPELHLVTEQRPSPHSQIRLSARSYDEHGIPRVELDWRVSDFDISEFHRIKRLFIADWERSPLGVRYPLIPSSDDAAIGEHLVLGGGIYHPCGTTVMGEASEGCVVDNQLRIHGMPSVMVAATSVLPSSGSVNPSLGVVQLALCRLARFLED